MIVIRDMLEKSWQGARRRMAIHGPQKLNHASSAGKYLELAAGDARKAIALLPNDESERPFWRVVAIYLALLEEQERNELSTRKAG